MTRDELTKLKELLSNATPGPWMDYGETVSQHWSIQPSKDIIELHGMDSCGGCNHELRSREEDRQLIAELRNLAPKLIEQIERMDAALAKADRAMYSARLAIRDNLGKGFAGDIDQLKEAEDIARAARLRDEEEQEK